MSADLPQELRHHDAIEQLIDDVFTIIHLEGRQGQAEVALIIEAYVASQLKKRPKRCPRRPRHRDPPTSTGRTGPGG